LDVGSQNIKIVEVRGSNRSLQVSAVAMAPTPVGAIQQGIVTDARAIGLAIKQLCQKNGIRTTKVVSAASGASAVVVRVIEVPKMTSAELAETMKWEVERHIPFPVNDVELAYQAIDDPSSPSSDPNNPNMDVLLAVAQRDMVASHLSMLQHAGLKPVAIDVEPLAIGRALLNLSSQGFGGRNVVIVNIGAANTEVAVFKGGVLRFPRPIPIAGDNFTRAIADTLGLTMEQAEEEKRQYAAVLMNVIADQQSAELSGEGAFGAFNAPAAAGPTPFVFGDHPFNAPGHVPPPLPDFGLASVGQETTTDEVSAAAAAAREETTGLETTGNSTNPFASSAVPTPTNPFADNPFAENPFAVPFPAAAGGPADAPEPTMHFGSGGHAEESTTMMMTSDMIAARDPNAARRRQIFDALLPILQELAMEVRRSVDYFRSRYPNDAVDQVLVCGGSARISSIDQFFQSELGVPTAIANSFAGVTIAAKQSSSERLADISPFFPVALGLAARDAILGTER
jgi:type IV pilus assembly protein PilM